VSVIFVDTVYYVAAILQRDGLHDRAVDLSARLADARFVTTDAVLVEVFAQLSDLGPRARAQATALNRRLRLDPAVTVIRNSDELFDASAELYRDRPDKGYSHTDCAGMIVCRRLEIAEVLAHDHHFEQEGFTILM
jgi:predicted nucleic acid-binding protein